MKKLMLMAAMLAMILAAGIPALAQTGSEDRFAAAAQYQYSAAELPTTGGPSAIALGAGVLLVAGGLVARRIVR